MGIGSNKLMFQWLGRASAGATLLEVVVAITILGVALPAGVLILNNSFRQYTEHALQEQALRLAQQELERVKAYRDANVYWYKTIEGAFQQPRVQGKFEIYFEVRKTTMGNRRIPMWRVGVTVRHPQLEQPVRLTLYLSQYVAQ